MAQKASKHKYKSRNEKTIIKSDINEEESDMFFIYLELSYVLLNRRQLYSSIYLGTNSFWHIGFVEGEYRKSIPHRDVDRRKRNVLISGPSNFG